MHDRSAVSELVALKFQGVRFEPGDTLGKRLCGSDRFYLTLENFRSLLAWFGIGLAWTVGLWWYFSPCNGAVSAMTWGSFGHPLFYLGVVGAACLTRSPCQLLD